MVNSTDTSYQPAVAYQGGQVNTPQQEPRNGQTQPVQAPAADTQRADQRTLSSGDDSSQASQDSKSAFSGTRGGSVNVTA